MRGDAGEELIATEPLGELAAMKHAALEVRLRRVGERSPEVTSFASRDVLTERAHHRLQSVLRSHVRR
jgi:hypothetical protein